jgi:hypothetical protein
MPANNYYRLRQTDFDGTETLSGIGGYSGRVVVE